MNALSSWSFALVFLLVVCGCSAGEDTPKRDTTIEIVKADVPVRYSAALPSTEAGLKSWLQGDEKFPPFVHVMDMLMNGDANSLEKFAAAAKAVPAAEGEAWAQLLDSALQYELPNDRACALMRPVARAPASTLRRALIGAYAGKCASDDDLPLIVREDTPDSAVLEYYGSLFGDGVKHPYHARLATAARKSILESEFVDRRTAFVLAKHPDKKAQAALRKIHSEIRDPKRADQVALAFYKSTEPKDKALASAACRRIPADSVCDRHLRTADGLVFDTGETPPDPPNSTTAEVKAMIDKLAAAGFTKVTTIDPATTGSDSPVHLLLIAGHAWWFDVETGVYPNNHDSLMRRLSALASPDLDDAIFEEVAPGVEDESKPYILTVYVGGKRLRAEARNYGDWYDVEAVLNLMNAVAKERGSKARFVGLSSQDQTMVIVGATEGAIARAVEDGLIEVESAADSR